jgi:hypothetical protein
MLESAVQKIEPSEASEIYGAKFILDDYPSDFSSISAWRRDQPAKNFKFWITSSSNKEDKKIPVEDWPINIDPFTQSNLIENEDIMIQQLIFRIRKSVLISHHVNLANRILSLFHYAKEEDCHSPGIAVESLRSFYYFLNKYPELKYPNITLTPDNNIYVSWEDGKNCLFSVHFLSDGNVNFVIFKPNEKHPKQKIRLSGYVTADSLMETADPNGVKEWIFE